MLKTSWLDIKGDLSIYNLAFQGSGTLSMSKFLLTTPILGMWSSCPHPYTALQSQANYKCPRKSRESLYNIVIGVPDPFIDQIHQEGSFNTHSKATQSPKNGGHFQSGFPILVLQHSKMLAGFLRRYRGNAHGQNELNGIYFLSKSYWGDLCIF